MKPPITYSAHRVATDERAYKDLVEATRSAPNGEIDDLERSIAAFEVKYGMSSTDAVAALARGELQPTLEVEGWMMAIRVRDHLVDVKARSG